MTINREHLATQKILDLILDECRYWQGRDEARRGSFAILYAAAKEIADQAQAAPVAEPVAWRWLYNGKPDGPYAFNYPLPDADVVARGLAAEHPRTVQPLYTAPQHDAELVELLTDAATLIEDVTHFPFGEPMTPADTSRKACSERLRVKLSSLREGGN